MAAELQPNEPAFSFRCTLCDEDTIGIPIGLHPDCNYVVCQECAADSVVPLLLKAAESEYHYPPKWGTVPIFHSHFLHMLPPDFPRDYAKKYNGYSTPIAERIYCRAPKLKLGLFKAPEQCGQFLGSQIRTPHCKGLSTVFKGYKCLGCGDETRISCRHCGDICSITPRHDDVNKYLHTLKFPHWTDHTCRNLTLDLNTAFDGLGLGREFQKCPNKRCGLRVELMSGCNHLVCTSVMCQTSFCAICGKEAKHDSDHWQAGKSSCPRWNKPGAHNAHFDDPPADVQDQVAVAEGLVRAARLHHRSLPHMFKLIQWQTKLQTTLCPFKTSSALHMRICLNPRSPERGLTELWLSELLFVTSRILALENKQWRCFHRFLIICTQLSCR